MPVDTRSRGTLEYSARLTISAKRVVVGEAFEALLTLSLGAPGAGGSGVGVSSFSLPEAEVDGASLNIALVAPGAQFRKDCFASAPLGLPADGELRALACREQMARFPLVALRPGRVEVVAELYLGEAYKGSVSAGLTVTSTRASAYEMAPYEVKPRPVLYPSLVLQVGTVWNEPGTACALRYVLRRLHYDPSSVPDQTVCQSDWLPADWLAYTQGLLGETVARFGGVPGAVAHDRLAALGHILYGRLIPGELSRAFALLPPEKRYSLLLLADQEAWFPWELLHDGAVFLGDRCTIGRWPRELYTRCGPEFPVGEMLFAHRAALPRAALEQRATLLGPRGARLLPGGLVTRPAGVEVRALYLLCATDADGSGLGWSAGRPTELERGLRSTKITLRRNRPLVELGFQGEGAPRLTRLEGEWAPAFLRAGCGALIGSLWTVSAAAEEGFTRGFYASLWSGGSLGEAFRSGCSAAREAAPASADYRAYVLYGDPMARPYRPEHGPGYTVIEFLGKDPGEQWEPGETVCVRASVCSKPPVWHDGRVLEVSGPPTSSEGEVHIASLSDSVALRVTPGSPVPLQRGGDGDLLGWFALTPTLAPGVRGETVLARCYFEQPERPLGHLTLHLPVGDQVG